MAKGGGNFHESYTHEDDEHGPSDRNFGLTVGGILFALGLIRIFLGHAGHPWLTYVFLVVGALLVIFALARPASLHALNRGWTKLGLLLFKVVNPIVMAPDLLHDDPPGRPLHAGSRPRSAAPEARAPNRRAIGSSASPLARRPTR